MKINILKNTILLIAIIGSIAGMTKILPIVHDGYKMYKSAILKESISKKVGNLKKRQNYISKNEIPEEFKKQILKSEDKRFYYHFGLDPIAVCRAMVNNIKSKAFVQGGSTITQQLAKNMYFSFEKKYERKIAELLVAFQLEKNFTKDEILELYCNIIFYGQDCYGLKDAAMHYYGVTPDKLTKDQIAALVFTIKSPNHYNPNVYHKNIQKNNNVYKKLAA